jgi:hypothetical protein
VATAAGVGGGGDKHTAKRARSLPPTLGAAPRRAALKKVTTGAGAAPDYTLIYRFLALLFDPVNRISAADAVKALRGLPALEQETAMLLVSNLERNLSSRTMWEQQMRSVCAGQPTFLTADPASFPKTEGAAARYAAPHRQTAVSAAIGTRGGESHPTAVRQLLAGVSYVPPDSSAAEYQARGVARHVAGVAHAAQMLHGRNAVGNVSSWQADLPPAAGLSAGPGLAPFGGVYSAPMAVAALGPTPQRAAVRDHLAGAAALLTNGGRGLTGESTGTAMSVPLYAVLGLLPQLHG